MWMGSSQMWPTALSSVRPRSVPDFSLCSPFGSFVSNLCLCLQFVTEPFYPPLSQDNPVTGRKADVIKAAHLCAEAALRLVKPGNQVSEWGWTVLGGSSALWDGHCEGMGGFVQTGRSGYLCWVVRICPVYSVCTISTGVQQVCLWMENVCLCSVESM